MQGQTSVLNATHDPAARSWVASANLDGCDFPIQNLPFGVLRRRGSDEPFRGAVAIGDRVLDLAALAAAPPAEIDALARTALNAAAASTLNELMALGQPAWTALRAALFAALREGSALRGAIEPLLLGADEVEHALPARVGDYTDFYTSVHHATAVGALFRPDNPLLPNYKWVPIGYHGRASSLVVSGHPVHRPQGQLKAADADMPNVGPCKRLDYELELGVFIGPGNPLGQPIALDDAESHVFGLCLLNDWSARDIQAWEYQPLGPFLSKSFVSTLSPWIVTLEALAPFRAAFLRPVQEPQPLAYLDSPTLRERGALDVRVGARLRTEAMREAGQPAVELSESSYRHAYWTLSQMVAHHTLNGCNLQPGDLLGTGTQSGPTPEEAGSLLELSAGGKRPLELPNGETRTFLQDGDSVELRAWCEAPGARRIGFGIAEGTVRPAR